MRQDRAATQFAGTGAPVLPSFEWKSGRPKELRDNDTSLSLSMRAREEGEAREYLPRLKKNAVGFHARRNAAAWWSLNKNLKLHYLLKES